MTQKTDSKARLEAHSFIRKYVILTDKRIDELIKRIETIETLLKVNYNIDVPSTTTDSLLARIVSIENKLNKYNIK